MERVLGGRFWGGWALAGGEEEDVERPELGNSFSGRKTSLLEANQPAFHRRP